MLKDLTDKEMIEALKEEKVPKSEWSAILNLEEEPEEGLGSYCDDRLQRDYDELKIN